MKTNFYLYLILILILASSCGEEVLTKGTISESDTGTKLESFSLGTCAQMHLKKPPVDILFVVDNSGSTLMPSFSAIKNQIANTVNTISDDFDYHVYIAPLLSNGEGLTGYPLILNYPNSVPNLTSVNVVNPSNLQFFSGVTGNNAEFGISRAYDLINANRSNGIFRSGVNTLVVIISNGDDTESLSSVAGNNVFNQNKFDALKNKFLSLSNKYATTKGTSSPLNSESLRFISLVAHSNCNGFKSGDNYKKLSQEVYKFMGYNDDNSFMNSRDLCSGNYAELFSSVNKSIKAVLIGHKYDHWLISNAKESQIEAKDIEVIKVLNNNTRVKIPENDTNGFSYIGYQENINTRYYPTAGAKVTGLVVKLNGSARTEYPDCIIAKTRTPTEYFGFIALSSEPDISTIELKVRGKILGKSATNGWTYVGYHETKNIKVPGPENVSITPPLNKTGYFLKLNGEAIYSNGESIEVFYKAQSIK